MKIHSKDFRVRPGEKVDVRKWPTIVKPFSCLQLLRDAVSPIATT